MNTHVLCFNFKEYPFRFFVNSKDYTDYAKNFINNLKNPDNLKFEEKNDKYIIYFDNNAKRDIFKKPITFFLLNQNKELFTIYNEETLQKSLNLLDLTYHFWKDGKIIEKEKIKFNTSTRIILIPLLYDLFRKLYQKVPKLKNLKISTIKIDPLILDPYLSISNKKMKEFDLIINQERIDFIMKIKDYINTPNTLEPMFIVGNDGIGKTITLQYLSSMDLNCQIFYFNIKHMEKYKYNEYIGMELLKSFLNKSNENNNNSDNNNLIKENMHSCFLSYFYFLTNYMKENHKKIKNIYDTLQFIVNNYGSDCVIIIDQFNYTSELSNEIKSFFNFYCYVKCILCCSLNDYDIKESLFSLLKKNIHNSDIDPKYIYKLEESSVKSENESSINENEEINDSYIYNFNEFIIFKRNDTEINKNKKKIKEKIDNNNIIISDDDIKIKNNSDNNDNNDKNSINNDNNDKNSINIDNNDNNDKNFININNNDKNFINIDNKLNINNDNNTIININMNNNINEKNNSNDNNDITNIGTNIKLNEDKTENNINFLNKKRTNVLEEFDEKYEINSEFEYKKEKYKTIDPERLYFNQLISVEEIIKDNKNIYDLLSFFNYYPKYYQKFIEFKEQKKENSKIQTIIQDFYNEQYLRIKDKIMHFYAIINSKNILNNLPTLNPIECLSRLKKVIEKNKKLYFYKLNKYSKIFPFKYLCINEYNQNKQQNYIDLNKKRESIFFTINYSFSFIKIVIEKLIKESIPDNILEINSLSGSAFGNALELKFREHIIENNYFKCKIETRKVWSFVPLDSKLKKKKFDEYKKEKDNKSNPFFNKIEELDDIVETKINLDNNYYYIIPKNQINKFFDSLILIKTDNNSKEFQMILLQLTKYKNKSKIKSKEYYIKFAKKKVKIKFEELYGIKITEIHLLFVLSNEDENNKDTCNYLNEKNISYIFFSIVKKMLFIKRDKDTIYLINDLINLGSLLYPYDNNYKESFIFNFKVIKETEKIIRNQLIEKEIIEYEKLRNDLFPHNIGPTIDSDLKNKIKKELKDLSKFQNDIEFLYFFSIPFSKIFEFSLDNDIFFIFKKGQIYLHNKDNNFIIDIKKKKLIKDDINLFSLLKSGGTIPEKVLDNFTLIDKNYELKNIQDISQGSSNVFIYKIYYLGNRYVLKNPK